MARVLLSHTEAGALMLKISKIDTPKRRKLVLEGKLISPWTAELRTAFEGARENLESRELVVDLKNVTVISDDGEALLAALMKEGVRFRCCGVFAKQVLRRLAPRARA